MCDFKKDVLVPAVVVPCMHQRQMFVCIILRYCDNVQNYISLAELAEASRTFHDIRLCSLPTYFLLLLLMVAGIKMSVV